MLYEWGTYDWGEGAYFEMSLTRQFVIGNADDDSIWQLRLEFRFSPTDALIALGSGEKQCPVPRARAVDYFEDFVRRTSAFGAVSDRPPVAVDLEYSNPG